MRRCTPKGKRCSIGRIEQPSREEYAWVGGVQWGRQEARRVERISGKVRWKIQTPSPSDPEERGCSMKLKGGVCGKS